MILEMKDEDSKKSEVMDITNDNDQNVYILFLNLKYPSKNV